MLSVQSSALLGCLFAVGFVSAGQPAITFKPGQGKLDIQVAGKPFATYIFQDDKTTRPHFAHVHAPNGRQVTRNHPPIAGKDLTDHDTFHPGIWLAFGDLSGADGWRNKAKVRHEKFLAEPTGGAGQGSFTVLNQYLAEDGKKVICQETCRFTFVVQPAGYLLMWDSQFRSDDAPFWFGDQEEMGLGVRLATPLIVQKGGQITTSTGFKNEKQARGKAAPWCDYSGTIDGQKMGVTLMAHPKNFRPSWYHARDYGLLVSNPFGRQALTGGERSKVAVAKGETFRLRFGVLVHASPAERPLDLAAAYDRYLKLAGN